MAEEDTDKVKEIIEKTFETVAQYVIYKYESSYIHACTCTFINDLFVVLLISIKPSSRGHFGGSPFLSVWRLSSFQKFKMY